MMEARLGKWSRKKRGPNFLNSLEWSIYKGPWLG